MTRSNEQIENDIKLLEEEMNELLAIEKSMEVPPLADVFNMGVRNKIRSVRQSIVTLIKKLK